MKIDPDKEDDVTVTNEYQETTDYHNIKKKIADIPPPGHPGEHTGGVLGAL
jgi:hypothetical protein